MELSLEWRRQAICTRPEEGLLKPPILVLCEALLEDEVTGHASRCCHRLKALLPLDLKEVKGG